MLHTHHQRNVTVEKGGKIPCDVYEKGANLCRKPEPKKKKRKNINMACL